MACGIQFRTPNHKCVCAFRHSGFVLEHAIQTCHSVAACAISSWGNEDARARSVPIWYIVGPSFDRIGFFAMVLILVTWKRQVIIKVAELW